MAGYSGPGISSQKNLSLSTSSASSNFPREIAERMGRILEAALNNNRETSQKERFLVAHAYKVAQFRRLKEYREDKDDLFRKISQSEAEGLRLGFDILEVRGINHFIVQKDKEGQLEYLFQRLEKKAGAK